MIVEKDRPFGRIVQTVQHAQHGRLACARCADHADHHRFVDRKADIVDSAIAAKTFGEIFDPKHKRPLLSSGGSAIGPH